MDLLLQHFAEENLKQGIYHHKATSRSCGKGLDAHCPRRQNMPKIPTSLTEVQHCSTPCSVLEYTQEWSLHPL